MKVPENEEVGILGGLALQSILLISSITRSHYPEDPFPIEPYFGADYQAFPKKTIVVAPATGASKTTTTSTVRQRKLFFTLGLPIRIKKIELRDSLTKFNLFFTPELHQTTDFSIFNFKLCPQMIFPFGSYTAEPSALVFEFNAGFSYGYLQYKTNKVNGAGIPLNSDQRTMMAGLVELMFGPQFDLGDFAAVRLRLSTELYIGEIPLYTIRAANSWMGMTMGLSSQFVF